MSPLSFRIPAVRPGRPQPLIGGFGGFGAGVVAGLITLGIFALSVIAVGLLCGCSATVETDNTPWGKARVATEAKPPPPIYARSSRSTVTKPPPPAPEVEETTCEGNVCGVPGR